MLCATLTVIVLGLLAIVCFGLDYFVPKGQEYRLSDQWMWGTTMALLVVSVSKVFARLQYIRIGWSKKETNV